MESNEIEILKSGTSMRSDKNAVIDYDEDRVRSELIARGLNVYEYCVLFVLEI